MPGKLSANASPRVTPRGTAVDGQSNSRVATKKKDEIQSEKRSKISRSEAEIFDDDGYQIVVTGKQQTKLRNQRLIEELQNNAGANRPRIQGVFKIDIQQPLAKEESEWKDVLDNGIEECPSDYFKTRTMSTNPANGEDLIRCFVLLSFQRLKLVYIQR